MGLGIKYKVLGVRVLGFGYLVFDNWYVHLVLSIGYFVSGDRGGSRKKREIKRKQGGRVPFCTPKMQVKPITQFDYVQSKQTGRWRGGAGAGEGVHDLYGKITVFHKKTPAVLCDF